MGIFNQGIILMPRQLHIVSTTQVGVWMGMRRVVIAETIDVVPTEQCPGRQMVDAILSDQGSYCFVDLLLATVRMAFCQQTNLVADIVLSNLFPLLPPRGCVVPTLAWVAQSQGVVAWRALWAITH